MLNLVHCGGFSPGARVLRKAVRKLAAEGKVNIVTLAPALAGLKGRAEEIRSLDKDSTLVLDGCEGGCGIQGMITLQADFSQHLILPKYPIVSDKAVEEAASMIEQLIAEME